jgi:hypothetical protein
MNKNMKTIKAYMLVNKITGKITDTDDDNLAIYPTKQKAKQNGLFSLSQVEGHEDCLDRIIECEVTY